MTATKLTLKPFPPFDFDLSAKIYSGDDRQISRYEDGKFWQVIRVDGKLVLVTINALGTVDEPKLSVKLESKERLSMMARKKAAAVVCTIFNLDFDLKPFYEEVKNDGVMACLTRRFKGLKSPTTPTVFEALIDSIVEQQISLKVANSMERKLIKTFGDSLKFDGKVYYAFPTAGKLAPTTTEQLRKCGLSAKKAEYIKEISKLIAEGKLNLERLKKEEDVKAIIDRLDEIRGIGVWTAEMTMVRGMQKFEALPADDLGLRRVISHYYCKDRLISSEEARTIAEKWGKWKGAAAFYLIMAEWASNKS